MSGMPRMGRRGMSAGIARAIEYVIVGISIAALVMIFQPFSLALFSVGAGLVILAGLAFNLIPLAQPGRPLSGLFKGAVVIAVVFVIVTALALGSAKLYAIYLTPSS